MVKIYGPSKIILTTIISLVWLINGLFCKILDFVPRHELIVSRILGAEYASFLTKAIGVAEILMVVWIISGIKPRYCALFQMLIAATMNVIEFVLVPDLLLFGKLNIVFAFLFIVMIYMNEFVIRKQKHYTLNSKL